MANETVWHQWTFSIMSYSKVSLKMRKAEILFVSMIPRYQMGIIAVAVNEALLALDLTLIEYTIVSIYMSTILSTWQFRTSWHCTKLVSLQEGNEIMMWPDCEHLLADLCLHGHAPPITCLVPWLLCPSFMCKLKYIVKNICFVELILILVPAAVVCVYKYKCIGRF